MLFSKAAPWHCYDSEVCVCVCVCVCEVGVRDLISISIPCVHLVLMSEMIRQVGGSKMKVKMEVTLQKFMMLIFV